MSADRPAVKPSIMDRTEAGCIPGSSMYSCTGGSRDARIFCSSSRFLVIIGSPAYLESKWCMEEVRFFRSLHNGTNQGILPLLVEGEPRQSLPEELFYRQGNTGLEEIEPLCADVRGDSIAASLKKLRL